MTLNRTCDGLLRRDFLALGALGASQVMFPTADRRAAASPTLAAGRGAGILIFLDGGPSHIDTFDPKPDAPAEYRGEFNAISTAVPGIQLCEHLPKLAQCTDKFAIVRGVSHTLAAHSLGAEYLHTGTKPVASLEHPAYGSVVLHERAPSEPVPGYVAMPSAAHGPGFLGTQYGSFATGGFPRPGEAVSVRGISLPVNLPLSEFDRRHVLLEQLNRRSDALLAGSDESAAIDGFARQAQAMISSPKTREAFNLASEPASFANRFGSQGFGGACLLAIRLIEAGVQFVSINFGGWDTHSNNFATLKEYLLPNLDVALSGLLTGLEERGLLASTSLMVVGEFGRTPQIGGGSPPGRGHYPQCMTALLAGQRIKSGQVVGASDATGSAPDAEAHSPDDVAATFYTSLGIDYQKVLYTSSGRPITVVRDGTPISDLVS